MLARLVRPALVMIALALWPVAGARAASLWSPVVSGTTHTISAIAYPSAGGLVFVTTRGDIFHQTAAGAFSPSTVKPANPRGFSDLAISAYGDGVAVGLGGKIYHSTDAGLTWTLAAAPSEFSGPCPSPGSSGALTDDLLSAQFADPNTVYVTGSNGDVLKSTDAGADFVEVNKSLGSCQANPLGRGFTDTAWIDAEHGELVSNALGHYFSTTTGLTTPATQRSNSNSGGDSVELAVDQGHPLDAWTVSARPRSSSSFQVTTDGGNSWQAPVYDQNQVGLRDIATAGGAVVTVGDGGDIYTSPDGRTFARQIAAPPYASTNWHAVAMLDSKHAAVAGADGALELTARANQRPDTIPPRGVISGPGSLGRGHVGAYSARVLDNPGGSGVDPAGYVWSTPGHADQTGPNASFAFSAAGTHSITVTFADLAGNWNNAEIDVRVGRQRRFGVKARVGALLNRRRAGPP